MPKISTLKKAHEVLLKLGFESVLNENSVAIRVGGSDFPFTAVITHNASTEHFRITCLLSTLKKVKKESLFRFMFAALDANSRIAPFAYAILTERDDWEEDNENDWPVVLTHSIPIGDFSTGELESAMHSLVQALLDSANVVDILSE